MSKLFKKFSSFHSSSYDATITSFSRPSFKGRCLLEIANEKRDLLRAVFINAVIRAKRNHEDGTNFIEKSVVYDDFELESDEDATANNFTFVI